MIGGSATSGPRNPRLVIGQLAPLDDLEAALLAVVCGEIRGATLQRVAELLGGRPPGTQSRNADRSPGPGDPDEAELVVLGQCCRGTLQGWVGGRIRRGLRARFLAGGSTREPVR